MKANEFVVPDLFTDRFESLALFLQMLNETANVYINGLDYSQRLSDEWVENAQLKALSRSILKAPQEVDQWVDSLFCRNKEGNRRVFNHLILPTARNSRHWFGAEYLHKKFLSMTVAERDLLWSCPDYLPKNCGGKWEGYAEFHLDEIDLYPDDSGTGMPLLMAWCCSSVVAKRVRVARTKLAFWGSENPGKLAILLSEMTSCNDYQVLESILTAAAGAACYAKDMDGLHALASRCYLMLFSESPLCSTRNSVCRHAARIVVERAFAYELVPEMWIRNARPPYKACSTLLPYMEMPNDWSRNPIHSDLEWYVVKDASKGFFEQVRPKNSFHEDEITYPKRDVMQAVVDGRINIRAEVGPKLEKLWDQMEADRKKSEGQMERIKTEGVRLTFGEAVCEESADNQQDAAVVEITSEMLASVPKQQDVKYSPEATALLAEYGKKYEIKNLAPGTLRNGLILAFVYSQGWKPELFYGKPNGGKEGEVLGADLAIAREHHPSSHGSRSPIASFGEKYIWLGVNEVAGDFADRMPTREIGDDTFEPVACYSDVGKEMPDPFDGEGGVINESRNSREMTFPEHFWCDYNTSGSSQLERSIDWVNNAIWPDIAKVISEGDQLRICSFIYGVESTDAVRQMIRITCLLIPAMQFKVF